MRVRAARLFAIVLLVLGLARTTEAQPSNPNAAEAVALARGAKERYDQGNWAEALTLFEQAEAKAHSPVLLLYAARCHRNLGHLVRAHATYRQVADEQLPDNAPEPFRQAQRDAKGDLEALEPRLSRVVLDRSRAPASWTIEIDGIPRTGAEPILLDPGKHVLATKEGDAETSRQEFTLREGETLPLAVGAATPSEPKPSGPVTPPPANQAEEGPTAADYAPGIVLLTLGAGGLAAGIATRVIAFQKVSDVKERCAGNVCLAADRDEIESADTFQTVSTVAFVVGGVAAATGIVLLVVLPAQRSGPSVSLRVQPGGVAVEGTF